MSTFFRYVLHFMMVSLFILLTIGIIGLFNNLPLNSKVTITIIFGVIFFSISMSAVFSAVLANEKEITLSYKSEEEKNTIINEIRRKAIDTLKREEVCTDPCEHVFRGKSQYSRWLTNPIEVRVEKGTIRVNTPKGYLKYFEILKN